MLLGMFTLTDNKRFVFWPVLPRGKAVVIDRPNTPVPDHITVQFPSEKVHVTWYKPSGKAVHHRDAWRSQPFECPKRNLLFMFLVRLGIVADQDVLISRKFPVPKSDNHRRNAEFGHAANNYRHHHLPIPGDASQADYACLAVYRTFEFMTQDSLPQSLLPGSAITPAVDGWLEDAHYWTMTAQVQLGDFKFCFAAGFPPGRLKDPLGFGFPRRIPVGCSKPANLPANACERRVNSSAAAGLTTPELS